MPCPSHPIYTVDIADPSALSICPGIREGGAWRFATDASASYEVTELGTDDDSAYATALCHLSETACVQTQYTVAADGVHLALSGSGEIACLLPAFFFDGEAHTAIHADKHCLTVSYGGWTCLYTVDGTVVDSGRIAANRNGHYRVFLATAQGTLNVKIEITKVSQL